MVKYKEEERFLTENTIMITAWRGVENEAINASKTYTNGHDSMNKAPRKTVWGFVKDVEKYHRNS